MATIKAALELTRLRRIRRDAAYAVRHWRAVTAHCGLNPKARNAMARTFPAVERGSRCKVRPAQLRQAAMAELEFSRSPVQSIILDDGYSCCGMEDAACYAREDALETAKLYAAMAAIA